MRKYMDCAFLSGVCVSDISNFLKTRCLPLKLKSNRQIEV